MSDFNKKYIKKSGDMYQHIEDNKRYITQTLSNGLKIIFVENKNLLKSSAYLTVNAGTNDNYKDCLGISHFLEHILFLGSEKYPNHDAYFKFIHDNGGNANAYTANTHTCYHFDVNSDCLEKALDIFSGFFICPLIDPKYIHSEVYAVDAEHNKNIYNQNWRDNHIRQKILNREHSCAKFGTGNIETLLKSDNPTKEDIDILTNKVRMFFNEHYSSDKMTLYICHNLTDSNFTEFVYNLFSQISQKKKVVAKNTIPIILYKKDHLKIMEIEPYLQVNQLSLSWLIKKNNDRIGKNIIKKDISCDILSEILCHQGMNTIFNFFYKKGYVEDININENILIGSIYIFQLQFSLTERGVKHIDTIISNVFSFIRCMRNDLNNMDDVDNYYYNYIKNFIIKLKTEFKNYSQMSSNELLEILIIIQDIYKIDFEHLLTESINITDNMDYHIRTLIKLLDQLQPGFCTIAKMIHGVKIKNAKLDKFYRIKYSLYEELSKKYDIHRDCSSDIVNFLPIDYGFISEKLLNISINTGGKINRFDSDHKIFIDSENPFRDDKIRISVEITPYESLCGNNDVLYLYLMIYSEYINTKYNAVMADLSSNMVYQIIRTKGERIDFSIVCYPTMVEKCLDMVIGFLKKTITDDKKEIDKIFELLIIELNNKLKKEPYIQLEYEILYNFLEKYCVRPEKLLSTINDFILSKKDITTISTTVIKIMKKGIIDALISGNVTEEYGNILANKINNMCSYKKDNIDDYTNAVSPKIKRINNFSDDFNTACCILYEIGDVQYGIGNWDKNICIAMILENIIKTIYFDELRTKGKLGYIVTTKLVNINLRESLLKYYITLCIQSKLDSEQLTNKSMNVINTMVQQTIKKMSTANLAQLKNGIMSDFQSIILNIEQREQHIKRCISSYIKKDGNIDYDYKKKLANTLSNVDINDVKKYFYDKFIKNKKKVVISINPNKS